MILFRFVAALFLGASALLYARKAEAAPGDVIAWGGSLVVTNHLLSDFSNVVQIGSGYGVYVGLRNDGSLITRSVFGTPFPLSLPAGLSNIVAVSVSPLHAEDPGMSLALRSDGTVWALKSGYSFDHNPPPPPGLSNVVAISAGLYHGLALKADGTVVSWGRTILGTQTNVPPGLSGVVGIAAGYAFSLALKGDGTVVSWGGRQSGGTNVPRGLSNVVAIAAGNNHGLALKSDGSLTGWGDVIPPPDISNVVAIATGGGYDLALTSYGKVVGWGYNGGYNAFPTSWLSNVVSISASTYSVARLGDGSPRSPAGPMSLVAAYGTPLLLPASTSGTRAISYQWNFNGVPLADETNATMILNSVDFTNDGTYSAIVSSALQTVTNTCSLRVMDMLITIPPTNQTVFGGTNVTFAVGVSGTNLKYQWQFNGVALPGATNSQLVLTNVLPEQAGTYTVIVSNPVGTESRSAILSVSGSLRIRGQPSSQTVLAGTTVTIATQVDGVAPIYYQWRFNDHDITGETNSFLVLTNAWLDRSGTYSLNCSNSYAALQSSNAELTVVTLRIIGPPGDQNPYRGASVTFGVAAEGIGGGFAYQWLFNGTVLSGATGSSLALTNVQFEQSGVYSVIVANSFTNVSASANLAVSQLANWNLPYDNMDNVPGLTNLVAVATGGFHNIALRRDGSVMVWGLNNAGVLPEATNVIAIAAGSERNLVLRADGTLLSWGSYTENQFGFPAGISNIVAIACGDGQNLALTADGIVIGSGSTFVSPAATNIVAIASGSGHSLALNADGNVLAWGYNGYGQTTVPDDATNVVAIAAGGYDSLALRGDGSLIGWGQNGNSLSAIPGRTNTIMIALGTGYSLGLDADGTVRGVGGAAISQGLKDVFSIAANSQGLALMGDSPPRTKAAMIPLRTTDGMVISLPLQSGRVARLEYVTNLEDTNWVALPLVPGNGATTHLIDPTTTGLQRFYRTRRW